MSHPMDPEFDPGKELQRMWQENALQPPVDPGALAREIAARMTRFDRRIWWRNFREYAAGAVLLVYFSWLILTAPALRPLALLGIAAVAVVLGYLWWQHRHTPPLDPSGDAAVYRTALLARIDRQIVLLRRVKYWYVLPLYLWMLAVVFTVPGQSTAGFWGRLVVMTAFSGFVVWLNESYGVRRLLRHRREVEQMIPGEPQ